MRIIILIYRLMQISTPASKPRAAEAASLSSSRDGHDEPFSSAGTSPMHLRLAGPGPAVEQQLYTGSMRASCSEFSRQIEEEIPFLRRNARRWHHDKTDADDLVQDTFVQALAKAHLWQPDSDLRAWLYTIMRNRFFATVAKSNRSASALQNVAAVDPGPAADPSELRLTLRDLGTALRRLSANQRSAVLLIGVQEKSYDEAAQTMGTTVAAVRCHLARGRDRLRTAIRGGDARLPFAHGRFERRGQWRIQPSPVSR